MSVCFSGDTIPPKDLLEWRAREAGLRVLTGVSKKLDVLVVDDPYSVTSKAQKARALGTRMLVVPVFLSLLSRLA
jgi:DNA polymerase III subunit epsilon